MTEQHVAVEKNDDNGASNNAAADGNNSSDSGRTCVGVNGWAHLREDASGTPHLTESIASSGHMCAAFDISLPCPSVFFPSCFMNLLLLLLSYSIMAIIVSHSRHVSFPYPDTFLLYFLLVYS